VPTYLLRAYNCMQSSCSSFFLFFLLLLLLFCIYCRAYYISNIYIYIYIYIYTMYIYIVCDYDTKYSSAFDVTRFKAFARYRVKSTQIRWGVEAELIDNRNRLMAYQSRPTSHPRCSRMRSRASRIALNSSGILDVAMKKKSLANDATSCISRFA